MSIRGVMFTNIVQSLATFFAKGHTHTHTRTHTHTFLMITKLLQGKALALTWRQRSKILKDVCRGLTWIHAITPPIIHGDVKM